MSNFTTTEIIFAQHVLQVVFVYVDELDMVKKGCYYRE